MKTLNKQDLFNEFNSLQSRLLNSREDIRKFETDCNTLLKNAKNFLNEDDHDEFKQDVIDSLFKLDCIYTRNNEDYDDISVEIDCLRRKFGASFADSLSASLSDAEVSVKIANGDEVYFLLEDEVLNIIEKTKEDYLK